jgi:excisionase family DNA binding protein
MTALEPRTCNPQEFAAAIGTSAERVRDLCHAGEIAHVRYGRHIKIPLSEVDDYLTRESRKRLKSPLDSRQ